MLGLGRLDEFVELLLLLFGLLDVFTLVDARLLGLMFCKLALKVFLLGQRYQRRRMLSLRLDLRRNMIAQVDGFIVEHHEDDPLRLLGFLRLGFRPNLTASNFTISFI